MKHKTFIIGLIFINLFGYLYSIEILDVSSLRTSVPYNEEGPQTHWRIYEGYAIANKEDKAIKSIKETWIDENGNLLHKVIIPGSPPPEEYDQNSPQLNRNVNAVVLNDVPATSWVFGCGPTAGQMIAGYYDRIGYDNIYRGPTNNGIYPLTNETWGTRDINGEIRALGPLSASMMGLDGRIERGHVDDYWYTEDSSIDPYIDGNWIEHDWYGNQIIQPCVADFMGTSQYDRYAMLDGATTVWMLEDGRTKVVDEFGETGDAAFGLKVFFENQGYEVADYFTQITVGNPLWENGNVGFTFLDYKDEIDNGRPVMIHLDGHIVVGTGYDNSTYPETIYFHNTWDYNVHTMDWNGNVDGMGMWGVSCFELAPLYTQSIDNVMIESKGYSLESIYPNPFNPTTHIIYNLPVNTKANISVYDLSGALVVNILNKFHIKGKYSINWHAHNLASGIYLVKLEATDIMLTKKIMIIK